MGAAEELHRVPEVLAITKRQISMLSLPDTAMEVHFPLQADQGFTTTSSQGSEMGEAGSLVCDPVVPKELKDYCNQHQPCVKIFSQSSLAGDPKVFFQLKSKHSGVSAGPRYLRTHPISMHG